jgi:hypothetical protein
MGLTSRNAANDNDASGGATVKLRSLIVTVVPLLSCTAVFAQNVQLGFLDHDKQTQYCDYEQLKVEKNNVVVTGTHYPSASGSSTCYSSPGLTGTVTGLMTNFPASSGLLVSGKVATFADDTYDRLGGYMGACGCTYYYVSLLRASTQEEIQNNVYGWAEYYNGQSSALRLHDRAGGQQQRECRSYLRSGVLVYGVEKGPRTMRGLSDLSSF